MKISFLIIWLLCLAKTTTAQLYQTQAGTIQAMGKYNGASVSAVSNRLFMHLNYDKAEIHIRLAIPSLLTDSDTLNQALLKLTGQEIAFDGKMNIAFVQTKSHAKQKITTQGMLFLNVTGRAFSFNSVLEHFPRGNARCILSSEFLIDLQQFNIDGIFPGEEKITVKFNQLVFKKPGEQ